LASSSANELERFTADPSSSLDASSSSEGVEDGSVARAMEARARRGVVDETRARDGDDEAIVVIARATHARGTARGRIVGGVLTVVVVAAIVVVERISRLAPSNAPRRAL